MSSTRVTAPPRDDQNTRRAKIAPLLAAGLSVRAISAETGISVGAVHRAKRRRTPELNAAMARRVRRSLWGRLREEPFDCSACSSISRRELV
jgi:DNA-binding NarL/FixJ family response regulator